MIVRLLTEHHLEFLSLTGDCRGSSESTLVKMSNCWKSHAAAHIVLIAQASNHGLLKDQHNLPNPLQLKICTRVVVQKKG